MTTPKPTSKRSALKDDKRRRFRGIDADQRQAERRIKLIEAGVECFGQHGFHHATVRQICAEAKLTERYFYESFKNREELFAAAYQQTVQRVRESIIAALVSSPREVPVMARNALRALFKMIHDDPGIGRILFMDVLTVSSVMDRMSREATQSFSDLLRQVVESMFPTGPETGLDAELISDALSGACIYVAMQWSFSGFRHPLDAVVNNCAALFVAMSEHAQKMSVGNAPKSSKKRA